MFNQILQSIGTVIIGACLAVAGWLGYEPNLGTTITQPVAFFESSLATKITSSATSMTLVSGTDKAGNDLNGYMCFTLEEGSVSQEVACGTASGTAITAMIRGVSPTDPTLEVSALQKEHRRGASVKITDYSFVILSRILNGDETLPNTISYATDTASFTNNAQIPNKLYVDSVATSGAAQASEIIPGLVELGTKTELSAGTATSAATTYLVPKLSYFNQTSTATSMVPVTNSSGKLSQGFLDLAANWTFSGTTTQTTINNTLAVTGTSTFATTVVFSAAPTINATATVGTDAVNKNYVSSLFNLVTTTSTESAYLRNSNDGATTTIGTSYVKLKETKILSIASGTIETIAIQFGLSAGSDNTAEAKVYINGNPVSAEFQHSGAGYTTETFYTTTTLAVNDLIQIYGKQTGIRECNVNNFRIYYKGRLVSINGFTLENNIYTIAIPTITFLNTAI